MCMQLNASFCFLCNVFWKRLHENLFCSSPSLFQFPGRNRLIGSNVQQISVSVPLFPCVNALSSKNTASLCIYCVRRWVLSFFPSPLYMDIEIVLSLFEINEWDCCWAEWEWANGRARKHVWEGLFVQILFKETNACKSWEEPVALCECERKRQVRVCS